MQATGPLIATGLASLSASNLSCFDFPPMSYCFFGHASHLLRFEFPPLCSKKHWSLLFGPKRGFECSSQALGSQPDGCHPGGRVSGPMDGLRLRGALRHGLHLPLPGAPKSTSQWTHFNYTLFLGGSPSLLVVAQKVYTLFWLVTGQVSLIGVLFSLVWLKIDGLRWLRYSFSSDQGHLFSKRTPMRVLFTGFRGRDGCPERIARVV